MAESKTVYRILDANLNRAREGLRVAEEIARLALEDAPMQRRIKQLRHGIVRAECCWDKAPLLSHRAVQRDPGARLTLGGETQRTGWADLVQANLRRTQEALRVLEEVSKLIPGRVSGLFKKLRFQAYGVEQELMQKLCQRNQAGGKNTGKRKKP